MENRAAKIHIPLWKDRISLLPEEILHHILCLLSQKTAIRTCVLSKAWRYLGCTRPKIEFGFITSDNSAILERTLQAYHDRNLHLDEFSLSLSDDDDDDDRYDDDDAATFLLNKWIPIITQSMCVKSFDLSFNTMADQVELPSSIFESHHIQNLSLQMCIFESSSSATRVGLKYLRRLHLSNVYIPEEILDKVLSISCPFIEDVSLEDCEGFTTIKLLSYKPKNLTRFCFGGHWNEYHHVNIEIGNSIQTLKSIKLKCCLLSVSHPEERILSGLFPCNLTNLYLCNVYVPEQILADVLSNCTFIGELHLLYCEGFTRVALLKNNTNVACFCFKGTAHADGDVSIEIGNDVQTLRTIEIERCLFSVISRDKPLEYVSLTRLSLTSVEMLSESFSCYNLHSLEELKLDRCYGIKEFNLSSRSMKRLSIHNISKPFRVTVDAPSIVSFNYEGVLPQSISFATTNSSDDHFWKSKINLGSSNGYVNHCFNELYGLLKAVSQSEISLELDYEIRWFHSQPPIAVEHLRIQRFRNIQYSSVDPFLNMFHVFRPSFVYMGREMLTYSNCERSSRVIAELLFKERGTTIHESYVWQRVLEEVGLQVLYRNQSEWQPVEYTSFTELSQNRKLELRIQLKWRE